MAGCDERGRVDGRDAQVGRGGVGGPGLAGAEIEAVAVVTFGVEDEDAVLRHA